MHVATAKELGVNSWLSPEPSAIHSLYSEEEFAPAMSSLTEMIRSYDRGDSFNFNLSAHQLREKLRALSPSIYPTEFKLQLEYLYNHLELFYRAIWLYGLAFVTLLIVQMRRGGRILRLSALTLAICAIAAHASGIVLRCLIAGRPPVSNTTTAVRHGPKAKLGSCVRSYSARVHRRIFG